MSNTGDGVDVAAGGTRPGGGAPGSGDRGPGPGTDAAPAPAPAPEDCGPLDRCGGFAVETVPDVTLADLASFRPATPTLTGEPSGFGVVGMPANLVATASEQHIPGTVLDWDVTVRFTPTVFVFDHGDGTSGRATTGGASWAALRQAQFTPTATSHVYRERGIYPVSVTVEYAAAVDFGSGFWRPVAGVVRATATGYDVTVVEVRTALVDRTCTEDPSGPGC
ncbi:hypothetical protein K0817_014730 [Microbacterium sp. HD4P20]|uniref:hypothetical protein n=1 Tax=Microbacterium sp. HD4P20 TaxID=2864874 RepID=UPI001C644359|nr:hypothetical protein [Microbacterium sp. HD4P20]MCP2637807.1 hypothetical protein [Microbacterium sp. HD4P20]